MTTDRQACGLSSFLPMSCRGRAEAFARRLQSRLQSLGRQPSGDHPTDSEQSWLTSSQHFPGATTSQPPRLSSSSDSSDVYFDFDVDYASPASPLEEASEDIHLNNGCVATVASPGSDDSSENLYFEPEADVDVAATPCNGADVTDDAGVGHLCAPTRARKPRVDHTKCNGVRQTSTETHEAKVVQQADTHKEDTRVHEAENELAHEEDTRVGLYEAEIELATKTHEAQTETHEEDTRVHEANVELATKTHEAQTETHEEDTRVHEANVELATETHEAQTETHEEDTRAHEANVELATETHEAQTETHEEDTVVHETDVELATETHEVDVLLATETHEAQSETHEQETRLYKAEIVLETETHEQEPRVDEAAAESNEATNVACTSEALCPKTDVDDSVSQPSIEITGAGAEPAREAAPRVAARDAGAARKLEVANDDTDDEDRPQRVRRCSSLKTGKTPPGTPGRKKIVRFADVLGLDLADIRTFLDEVPKVPTSAYEDLTDADLSSSLSSLAAVIGGALPKPDKTLVPMFVQPGGCADFFDRVREQQVCLENAVISDVMLATVSGTVRVRNLDFNKSVHIRYSVDAWKTFSDLQASYVQNSCDGFSDTFSFVLYAHTLTVGQRLEFAVRFQCHGCQYWDSNRGGNYVFQCLPPTGQLPYRSHPPMSTCPDEQWASFY